MTEIKEVVRYERVPVDQALLQKHCERVSLAEAQTYGDVEARAAQLFVCVQLHNQDKTKIEGLQ